MAILPKPEESGSSRPLSAGRQKKTLPSKRRSGYSSYLWIFIPFLLVIVLTSALVLRRVEKKRLQAIDSSAKSESIIPVEVIDIQTRDIPRFIRSSSVIRAWQKAVILSEVSGKVKSITAKVGNYLTPGSPILKIDDEMLQYALEQAEAQVLQLEANREISNKNFERKKALFNNNVISELEFDIVRAKEKADQALLDSAKASLKITRRNLRETLITSPINGILAERAIDIGTNVAVGTKVATVVDIEKVKIKVGVSERVIAKIKEGQPVKVETDAYPGKIYSGTVYSVGTKADDFTLAFPVEIMIINNQGFILKPGMTARIAIKTGIYAAAVSLPQEAVVENGGQHYVWTVNSGRSNKVQVQPYDLVGSQIVIQSGLEPGQLVAVSGLERLFEGSRVQIIED